MMNNKNVYVIFNNSNKENKNFYINEEEYCIKNFIKTYFDIEFDDLNKKLLIIDEINNNFFKPLITIFKNTNNYSILGKVDKNDNVVDYYITLNFNSYYNIKENKYIEIRNSFLDYIKNN